MEKTTQSKIFQNLLQESKVKDRIYTVTKNVYVQCPTHPEFEITNICTTESCLEPLCPECVKIHLKLHDSLETKPNIDTIFEMRQNCLDYIKNTKMSFFKNRDTLHQYSDKKKGEMLDRCRLKLEKAKEKLFELISSYFNTLEKEIVENIEKHRDAHPGEFTKINERINRVLSDLEKSEIKISSPDYLKPMLKTIHEQTQNRNYEGLRNDIEQGLEQYAQNLIDVQIDETKLYTILPELRNYAFLTEATNNFKLSSSNFKNSQRNPIPVFNSPELNKFSPQKENFEPESNKNLKQNLAYYLPNNLTSNTFAKENLQISKENLNYFNEESTNVTVYPSFLDIKMNDYFERDCQRKFLFFFQENSRVFHFINIDDLSFSSQILFKKIAIITPNGQIYVTGGLDPDTRKRAINSTFFLDYENKQLISKNNMNVPRFHHGICYINNTIIIAGGCSNLNSQCLSSCEKYDIFSGQWTQINPLKQQVMGTSLVPFQNKFVIKFGGKPNLLAHTNPCIEIYDFYTNIWSVVDFAGQEQLSNLFNGGIQINNSEILIFGGEKNTAKNEISRSVDSYVLKINSLTTNFNATLYKYQNLPNAGVFWGSIFISNNSLFAIETVPEDQRTYKFGQRIVLMLPSGKKWKNI